MFSLAVIGQRQKRTKTGQRRPKRTSHHRVIWPVSGNAEGWPYDRDWGAFQNGRYAKSSPVAGGPTAVWQVPDHQYGKPAVPYQSSPPTASDQHTPFRHRIRNDRSHRKRTIGSCTDARHSPRPSKLVPAASGPLAMIAAALMAETHHGSVAPPRERGRAPVARGEAMPLFRSTKDGWPHR